LDFDEGTVETLTVFGKAQDIANSKVLGDCTWRMDPFRRWQLRGHDRSSSFFPQIPVEISV